MRSSLLALVPLLVACGGSGASALGLDGGGITPLGNGGSVVDNGGSVAFSVAQAYFTRGPWCGSPPPFTPQDDFSLVLYGSPQSQPMPWPTLSLVVYATAPVGTPQTLTLVPWKPGPPPTQGQNDVNEEVAYGNDAKGNPLLSLSLSRGMTTSLPDPNPYDQATMTALAIPTKEGDSLQVRVQLHFTDGATLDQTFVSQPLAETNVPCGGARSP